ncbi:MAG TPA: alpha/beta hydrolase [Gemmatimonadaceae bacterium]|nr:alpha/beta hydrolase [Gemmatimonadaceae bacterium]
MRRVAKVVLWLGLGVVLACGALVLWLLRDPEPYFLERRSMVVAVDSMAETADETALVQDFTLLAANDLRVELAVRRPLGADTLTERRPLYIILGGQRRGKRAGALIGDTRGNIFASLEYPFEGDADADGFALVRQVPEIRQALFDTPPAVMLALDYLLSRPDVDTTRVELVGASFGAPFAVIAAALDPRVTRLWLAHGGGEPYELIKRGLEPEIDNGILRTMVAGAANLIASGPRLAPEEWIGRVAPRPVVMLNAEDDERIPRRSAEVLWEAAREPKEMIWLPGMHMQGNRPETLEELVTRILAVADPLSVEP